MHVDHITFIDQIKFQAVKMRVLRGYYYSRKRDYTIQDEIKKIFEIRKQYKAEGNPLHEINKLSLNTIYGKTILRPIDTTTKLIRMKIQRNISTDSLIKSKGRNQYMDVNFNELERSSLSINTSIFVRWVLIY
jgi:hypothetical protein